MPRILIIDDEAVIRQTLREVLEYETYEVEEAENAKKALERLKKESFDVVFCDIKMPQMNGLEFLADFKNKTTTPVIMITGHGDVETAVEALRGGAFDFIQKPLDLNRLLLSVRDAIEKAKQSTDSTSVKKEIDKKYEIVGISPAIVEMKELIEKVAPTHARVLITGESGTGKELVAHWLHCKSHRSQKAFVEVNCAAIPSGLIEDELFGHEKGSFTSAVKQRKGNFELADNGTLFLDEIGDMDLDAQAKMLRALQEGKITRVGSEKEISVDVRVIAATNKNLQEEVEKKLFREDLYHRLSAIIIHVPPLRDRKEDIPLLAKHFMEQICEIEMLPLYRFEQGALDELQSMTWKGNVRELRNAVERLLIFCNKTITRKDIKKHVGTLNK